MKHSTSNKSLHLFGVILWLFIWQILSMIIKEEILMVSPLIVIKALWKMILEKDFWQRVFISFGKITVGFFLGALGGSVMGAFSYKSKFAYALISPINQIIKSTPIASFIILLLFWVKSSNISIIISFLIVFPLFYSNIREGAENTDIKMLQMAEIYNFSTKNKILYIYFPEIMPYFISACSMGLGMCWKAGIAAEVIATPQNSIGDALYRSKINLDTAYLFAWTAVIIFISVAFEKIFLKIIQKLNEIFYKKENLND